MNLHMINYTHGVLDVIVEPSIFHEGEKEEYMMTKLTLNTVGGGELVYNLYPEVRTEQIKIHHVERKEEKGSEL